MQTIAGNNKPSLLYLQHVSAHLGYFPGVQHTKIASKALHEIITLNMTVQLKKYKSMAKNM
jgi:hypothetical protein